MAVDEPLPDGTRVTVLCGGPGVEREVSLESGAAVEAGLRKAGLDARRVEIAGRAEEIEALDTEVVFVALHGEFGEDGTVQALLEERGLPYTGSSATACAVAMDKDATKKALSRACAPTAPWVIGRTAEEIRNNLRRRELPPPWVIKPAGKGSSVGVRIVRKEDELEAAVEEARAVDETVLAELFVPGRELTIGILDDAPLPPIELKPRGAFFDYEAKYRDDTPEHLCPAPLDAPTTRRLQAMAHDIHRVLGARDMSRVDLILSPRGPRILEINMIPGFTPHSLLPLAAEAAGTPFPALCRGLVELAWRRRHQPEAKTR